MLNRSRSCAAIVRETGGAFHKSRGFATTPKVVVVDEMHLAAQGLGENRRRASMRCGKIFFRFN